MIEKIVENKNTVLKRMEQAISERGPERMDVNEVGKLADIVKDLAEAEKECRQADYYKSVVEAMGSSGYIPEEMGYDMGRSGYRGANGAGRNSMGRFTSRGYQGGYGHQDMVETVREMLDSADTQERERLRKQLREL